MGTHSQIGCRRIEGGDFYREHGYWETPMLVQWMATLRCGLRCEHCLAASREAGFSDMPLDEVRGLIDELAAMGVGEFLVTGGEPLAREDLGEVIEHLGRNRMNWTLNTAAMPDRSLREVLSRNKPGFVAVSLDGPRAVHDAFRGRAGAWDEAMEAIRFFKSLGAVRVCAGTTVTSRNYDYLDETFHLATTCGADQWGIHLLVPEGRAADRPDLFLSKTQLKRLIQFVARRRRQFPVQVADEIGYLGYLEPLVRDVPLHCGAGRAQCVVLPDGEVVPCTTLDRSCSAGNIHDRSFRAIWAEGFAELRVSRPSGKCGGCEYAVACKGGCWLHRKAGTQCFKEVWHVPGALKTAAGIAICLGGLSGPTGGVSAAVAERPAASPQVGVLQSWSLDEAINTWYFRQANPRAHGVTVPANDPVWADAGWRFFHDFQNGALPQSVSERCERVREALETQERSLSLISLLWRAVNGPLFETGDPQEYSGEQRQAIAETLMAIRLKCLDWRLEIFEHSLDPYVSGGRVTPLSPGSMTKAAVPNEGRDTRYWQLKDLNEERWGAAANPETRAAAEAYAKDHRYAEQMDLVFTNSSLVRRVAFSAGEVAVAQGELGAYGPNRMEVFDVMTLDYAVNASFEIKGDLRRDAPPQFNRDESDLLDDGPGEQELSTVVTATLKAGTQYTYTELLNAVYEQNRLALLAIAYDWLSANEVGLWDQRVPLVTAAHENGALLWPAIREILECNGVIPTDGASDNATRTFSPAEIAEMHRRAVLKDIDFWML